MPEWRDSGGTPELRAATSCDLGSGGQSTKHAAIECSSCTEMQEHNLTSAAMQLASNLYLRHTSQTAIQSAIFTPLMNIVNNWCIWSIETPSLMTFATPYPWMLCKK